MSILTDNGPEFVSEIFTEICKILKINKMMSSTCHPQTNGGLERAYRVIKEMLWHTVDQHAQNWCEHIPFVTKICEDLQKEHPEIFNTTCGNFALTSASLLHEINRKRFKMLQSIDTEEINKREKRGLINLVGHIQKTLFGTLDNEDGEMYNTQIRELQNSRVGMLKIVDKQTT